jgi:hypothetical protein
MRLPSAEYVFSCGESPEAKPPTSVPVSVSRMCTTFPVEAETATRVPSGDRPMWSERWPSTTNRHAMLPLARSMPTTSRRLGRDTTRRRPPSALYMSSTNWSWPSPMATRMARKYASRTGSA